MSADLLRRAADAIRAEVANAPDRTVVDERVGGIWLNSSYYLTTTPSRELALADWLEHEADVHESLREFGARGLRTDGQVPNAFAVARTYLGEAS